MIDCATEFKDANYTWTEDPFGPDFIWEWHFIEMGPVFNPINIKHHRIISQDLWFPEEIN